MTKIQNELFRLRDEKYAAFQGKLIPNIPQKNYVGVRTPALRALAKKLRKEDGASKFLESLPHRYFDENQLHAFIISEEKDYDLCLKQVEEFLPFVDNWATCDQLSPKVFKKNREKLLKSIRKWLKSHETYTVRFAIKMLMEHFLDEDFDPKYPEMVCRVRSDEYYVNMMIAWYFATALAKQYENVLPYIENKKLERWTHNKAIQKSVESFRISPEQKEYLKTMRIREERIKEKDGKRV